MLLMYLWDALVSTLARSTRPSLVGRIIFPCMCLTVLTYYLLTS